MLSIAFHQQHAGLHGSFGAGWKPYFIIHLRLIEMKIGTLLDIGHNSAANVKIVVEDCIQMGDLAISFIDPQSALQFL